MKGKRRTLIVFVVIIISIIVLIHENIKIDFQRTENVYLDVLNEDEISYRRFELEETDEKELVSIFEHEVIWKDNGFVHSEGQYRLVFDMGDRSIELYPYCGSARMPWCINKTTKFYSIESEPNVKIIEQIITKYIEVEEYIASWENIKN